MSANGKNSGVGRRRFIGGAFGGVAACLTQLSHLGAHSVGKSFVFSGRFA